MLAIEREPALWVRQQNEGRKGRKGRKPRILRKWGPFRRWREAAETGGNWRKPPAGRRLDWHIACGNCGNSFSPVRSLRLDTGDLTDSAHLARSSRSCAAHCSRLSGLASSANSLISRSWIVGEAMASLISVFSFSSIGRGVALGTAIGRARTARRESDMRNELMARQSGAKPVHGQRAACSPTLRPWQHQVVRRSAESASSISPA